MIQAHVRALSGQALDWAVSEALGYRPMKNPRCGGHVFVGGWWETAAFIETRPNEYRRIPGYSFDWSVGGPIIEQEKLELRPGLYGAPLWAAWGQTQHGGRNTTQGKTGGTPLVAAMRCFVASKLGEKTGIPEEFM